MDNKTNSRYDVILCIDLLTALVMDLKFSKNIIIVVKGPYEVCYTPMVDLRKYDFKSFTENIV